MGFPRFLETFLNSNDDDLAEALDYMQSGESTTATCVMKIFIILGYEGPSLSESATFLSGRDRETWPRRSRHRDSDSSSSGRRRRAERAGSSLESYTSDSQYSPRSRTPNPSVSGQSGYNDHWRNRQERRLEGQARRSFPGLREGYLDNTSSGREELERRWLLQTSSASSRAVSDPESDKQRAATAPSSLAVYQSGALVRLTSLVQTNLGPDSLRCCSCQEKLVDLRFVCQECGPLREPVASPTSDNVDEAANTGETGLSSGTSKPDGSSRGYELCELCVENGAHARNKDLEDPSKHVFIEAHRALDSRGWRVVGEYRL